MRCASWKPQAKATVFIGAWPFSSITRAASSRALSTNSAGVSFASRAKVRAKLRSLMCATRASTATVSSSPRCAITYCCTCATGDAGSSCGVRKGLNCDCPPARCVNTTSRLATCSATSLPWCCASR